MKPKRRKPMPRLAAAARALTQKKVSAQVVAFENENAELVEALRLFGISNAEYEKALKALNTSKISTSISTQPNIEEM